MKVVLATAIFCTALIVGYTNCADDDSPAAVGDKNTGVSPSNLTLEYLFAHFKLYINGVETEPNPPVEVKVGDQVWVESTLESGSTWQTKFSIFNDCKYAETIQDWSTDEDTVNNKYNIKASDKTDCTSLNVWIRGDRDTEPWPKDSDIQHSLLLNVTDI